MLPRAEPDPLEESFRLAPREMRFTVRLFFGITFSLISLIWLAVWLSNR